MKGWRWIWAGGWLTGYACRWTTDHPDGLLALVLDLGIALGAAPLLALYLTRRSARPKENP